MPYKDRVQNPKPSILGGRRTPLTLQVAMTKLLTVLLLSFAVSLRCRTSPEMRLALHDASATGLLAATVIVSACDLKRLMPIAQCKPGVCISTEGVPGSDCRQCNKLNLMPQANCPKKNPCNNKNAPCVACAKYKLMPANSCTAPGSSPAPAPTTLPPHHAVGQPDTRSDDCQSNACGDDTK